MNAKIKFNKDTIYSAKPQLIDYKENVIGDLYEDFYVVTIDSKKTHLVQSGRFYIREYYMDNNCSKVGYNDFLIDPETLVDITNIDEPIFIGCDLAREIDLTYYSGEYYSERLHS